MLTASQDIYPSDKCRICRKNAECFDRTEILRKYTVSYFRCTACGFVQTETPYWLEEAYGKAISKLDTGILFRNIRSRRITTAVLSLLFPRVKSSLDFGAGHGIFVRLMRDSGFNFHWYDLHATNDYAGGFEHHNGMTYDFMTAFEVLEHLVDPVSEISKMMSLSPNVFVSTELLPKPTPKIPDWWYYTPKSGQHISFFTLDSLRIIARQFGRHLLSCGPYHLFTTSPKSSVIYRMATNGKASAILSAFHSRPSLIESDLRFLGE